MRISDWSSDVCSSDLWSSKIRHGASIVQRSSATALVLMIARPRLPASRRIPPSGEKGAETGRSIFSSRLSAGAACQRSEEHTSELQSLMRISYAVFCLKKTKETQYAIEEVEIIDQVIA